MHIQRQTHMYVYHGRTNEQRIALCDSNFSIHYCCIIYNLTLRPERATPVVHLTLRPQRAPPVVHLEKQPVQNVTDTAL